MVLHTYNPRPEPTFGDGLTPIRSRSVSDEYSSQTPALVTFGILGLGLALAGYWAYGLLKPKPRIRGVDLTKYQKR
jgi:hypothetical protein